MYNWVMNVFVLPSIMKNGILSTLGSISKLKIIPTHLFIQHLLHACQLLALRVCARTCVHACMQSLYLGACYGCGCSVAAHKHSTAEPPGHRHEHPGSPPAGERQGQLDKRVFWEDTKHYHWKQPITAPYIVLILIYSSIHSSSAP